MKVNKKKMRWGILLYVFSLLFFVGDAIYQGLRPLETESYQVTTLLIDKVKPTYYVELAGERRDVSMVRPGKGEFKVLLYEGLDVTALKIVGDDGFYVYSGVLSVDEVFYKVHRSVWVLPALVAVFVCFFGGLGVLVAYRHRRT